MNAALLFKENNKSNPNVFNRIIWHSCLSLIAENKNNDANLVCRIGKYFKRKMETFEKIMWTKNLQHMFCFFFKTGFPTSLKKV